MSRTEDDLTRRTRRVVIATVALLACALVGSVVCWRLHLGYDVNGRLRALQRAGLPTECLRSAGTTETDAHRLGKIDGSVRPVVTI